MADRIYRRKAQTPDAREQQMIAYAMDYAEQAFTRGDAPAAVVVHYLKLATRERELELKKIEAEIEASKAKAEQARSNKRLEEMFEKAFSALREYQGLGPAEVDPELYPSSEGFI